MEVFSDDDDDDDDGYSPGFAYHSEEYQEMIRMYEELEAYDNHVCLDASSVHLLLLSFIIGSICGMFVKRVL